MKPSSVVILLLFGAVICAEAYAADRIEITASVDKQSVYVGDLIRYSVSIIYDSTIELTPPAVGANLGQFDVKDYEVGEEKILEDGRHWQQLNFVMRTFTTGEYIIPPLPIEYMLPDSTRKVVSSDPIKIDLKSLLAEGEAADTLQLKPLKGQVSLAKDRTALYLGIAAAILILGALTVYLVIGRRKRRGEEIYIDPRPAWEIAFADLAMLKEKNLPAKGEIKRFYFELSDIFRRYLGKKFDFNAIDLTTDEIREHFGRTTLPEETGVEIAEFLEHADLVKFAKYVPTDERPSLDWESAYRMVEKTREIFIGPAGETELVSVQAATETDDEEWEDPELKYVPPELRDRVLSQKRGEDA